MTRALPYSRVAGGGDLVPSQPDDLVVVGNRLEWAYTNAAGGDTNFMGPILAAGGLNGIIPIPLMTQTIAQGLTGWTTANLVGLRSWIEVEGFGQFPMVQADAAAVAAAAAGALRQEVVLQAVGPAGSVPLIPVGAGELGDWLGIAQPLNNWSIGAWSISGALGVPVPFIYSYSAVNLQIRLTVEAMAQKG